MTLHTLTSTAASRGALRNWRANVDAIRQTQRNFVEPALPDDLEWVFARDGSLTARVQSRWLAGCSVPHRAAQEMLRKLDVAGPVACFLVPDHAHALRVALDKLRPEQAIIAVVPDESPLAAVLHCEDFSRDVLAHRLWFAAGEQWETRLRELLTERPGLSVPTQFIRLRTAEETRVSQLISAAQRVFSDIATDRATRLRAIHVNQTAPPRGVCVVASSRFRLWDDAGAQLAEVAGDALGDDANSLRRIDPDDPAQASPLALAIFSAESRAILTANLCRADVPGVAPVAVPWITWIANERPIPRFTSAGPRDRLILADVTIATKAGWPIARLHAATWPLRLAGELARRSSVETANGEQARRLHEDGSGQRTIEALAIVADTRALDTPEELNEFSSHAVLWEAIRGELLADPLALGTDVQSYLSQRMQRLEIADAGFPRARFIAELIMPAFAQGIARLIVGSGLPLKVFGAGWSELPEFSSFAGGNVASREELTSIARRPLALVDVWPGCGTHPSESLGAPVIRVSGKSREQILRELRKCIATEVATLRQKFCDAPPLDGSVLRDALRAAGVAVASGS